MYSDRVITLNRLKVFFYMLIITSIIMGIGYYVSELMGWGLTGVGGFLVFAGLLNFVSYFFSDVIVIKTSGAVPLKEEDMPEYFAMVRDMCNRSDIKMPRLYLVNTDAMNAFATGRDQDHAIVAVTSGLLKRLSLEEVSGVVGHELSHIANSDILLMSVVAVLVGFISMFTNFLIRNGAMNRNRRDESGISIITGLILMIAAPLVATFIKFAISRSREYMADAKGAQICGNPQYLASALAKISGDDYPMPNVNEATAHLYISNPFRNGLFAKLLSTHPNINDRINKLEKMA